MELNRFVKTLAYFGVVPFLSNFDWFQQLLDVPPPLYAKTMIISDRSAHPLPLFNFRTNTHFSSDLPQNLENIWGAVDDVVMGGVSQSFIKISEAGAIFSGIVSTANSGGFVSVRTRNLEPALNLSNYDGIELRVKGDGNRYKFLVRTENQWDGIAFSTSFDTESEKWLTIRLPFASMIPVFRAKVMTGVSLNSSRIYAFQLMLSKFEYDRGLNPHFKAGHFQLQIESIQAY